MIGGKTQKKVQGGVEKKGEGLMSKKKKQNKKKLYLVNLKGTETQEVIPVTRLGGLRG